MMRVKAEGQLKRLLFGALIATGVMATVATSSQPPCPEECPDFEVRLEMKRWLVANRYDGQTAVDPDEPVLVGADFTQLSDNGGVILFDLETMEEVAFRIDPHYDDQYAGLEPSGGFKRDRDYLLYLADLRKELGAEWAFPDYIEFSTASKPHVKGIWRTGETLLVVFSEPMDDSSIRLAQDSVDLVYEAKGELYSVAADHNLASYAWDVRDNLFLVSPIPTWPFYLKIDPLVRARTGKNLDSDLDGVGGEQEDAFLEEINPYDLPTCFSRDDIPEPCLTDAEATTAVSEETISWERSDTDL